jgi:peptidoglycan hydrolase-like protein with peptidoglycan-binding domain
MNLLNTLLVYLTMVFVSSVQMAPELSPVPATPTPAPTAISQQATLSPTQAVTPSILATATPTPMPTPAITPNSAYHTLQVGDRSDEVSAMQRRLADLGYYSGDIDGAYGNVTRRAVEKFQYYQGLTADGIAGKRTLTVLYESPDVVVAPTDTPATATPRATATPAPTTAPSPTPKITDTPTPNVTPEPTAKPEPTASDTPEPAKETPVLTKLTDIQLLFAGQTTPLTQQSDSSATQTQNEELHPLQYGDTVYMPVLDILKSAGSLVLPGTATSTESEMAFTLNNDLFQLSYTLNEANEVSQVTVLKNQQPTIITDRTGFLIDDVLYLPAQSVTDALGITFTKDDNTGNYVVTLPGA